MSSSRETILGRVNDALAPLSKRAPLPDWESELIDLRKKQTSADLWTIFAERLKSINGTTLVGGSELAAWLESNQWTHGYVDPLLWPELEAWLPGPRFKVETWFDRNRVDDFQFGITAATGAIAETGTLILTDRDTSSRLGALAPWAHIAIIKREQIFADMAAAISMMTSDPNVIWVTGPSKTADIEGILIEGVHGPGRQVALLMGE